MIQLTDEEKQFKLPLSSEDARSFFSSYPAEKWDIETYFEAKKQSKVSKVYHNYDNDLNWITRQGNLPPRIKEYARDLISVPKPKPALLKANQARHACKKRKMNREIVIQNSQNVIVNSGSVINSTLSNSGQTTASNTNQAEQDDNGQSNNERPSIWKDWKTYIESSLDSFHPFSLVANDIVRAGKGVSDRPLLDENLYKQHMSQKSNSRYLMPEDFKAHIRAFAMAKNKPESKSVIYGLSLLLSQKEDANMEFVHDVLVEMCRTYTSHIDIQQSEDAFNQLFIWPYLLAMSRSISETIDSSISSEFLTGQPILQSMTKQLKAVGLYIDDAHVYKSDGLFQLSGSIKEELLLLETSGCFANNDKSKVNFDHHKGVYGMLAMLKSIADDYYYASLDSFMRIKVYFLHAADEHLHLWSVSYQEEGIFDLWREAAVRILPSDADKLTHVPSFMQFMWTTKSLLEKSISDIISLKQEHEKVNIEQAFSETQSPLLSEIINPIILKLTKEDDHHDMSKLGPNYSPLHS
ncbi:hypothetical protein [Parasitella parasitica]|uniref:Uncharacterized protein n=1 Tax=Parasitella parasitica TaxID=35722 RepID=A0A0B7NN76_9FUNG|nr:hypothetical protein [Parasitella parasitica]